MAAFVISELTASVVPGRTLHSARGFRARGSEREAETELHADRRAVVDNRAVRDRIL